MSSSASTTESDQLHSLLLSFSSVSLSSSSTYSESNNTNTSSNITSNNITNNEDILIEALGICSVIGYESETNHCIGLCKNARHDFNFLVACAKTTVVSYCKKYKHRLMYSCMTGNMDWFRALYIVGNKYDILALRTKDNKTLYHLLTMNLYEKDVVFNIDSNAGVVIDWKNGICDKAFHASPLTNITGRIGIIDILGKTTLPLDEKDIYGNTCLDLAIKYQEEEIFSTFIQHVPVDKLNIVNHRGQSLLHMAISTQNINIINRLCTVKGINMMIKDNQQRTPIQYAAIMDKKLVAELLQYPDKYDINVINEFDDSLVHYAVYGDNVNVVRLLASNPLIPLDKSDGSGNTPLLWAVIQGKSSIVRELLQYPDRININSQNNYGYTALHIACEKHDYGNVQLLLDAGCDPSIPKKYGQVPFHIVGKKVGIIPLHIACKNGDIDIVRKILEYKAKFDINSQTESGDTALHFAVNNKRIEIVHLLLEAGSSISITNKHNINVIMLCTRSDTVELMELFLQHQDKYDIYAVDVSDDSLVHYAVDGGKVNIVRLLLASVPNINLDNKNNYGYTPLLSAVWGSKQSIVNELLQYSDRININSQNNEGDTGLHMACAKNQAGIVQLLLAAGSDPSIRNKYGQVPFHIACLKRSIDIVRKLLLHKDKFNINSQTDTGSTVLHSAIQKKCTEIHQVLIQAGIDITIQDKYGKTAAYYYNNRV